VETELIDVCKLPMKLDDAGEQMKDPTFSAMIDRCDGLIIVTPEYNHGYPGLLKHALDMNLKEYIHKAVGICGVSAGPFGGARVIEGLLPVMRELGLVAIFEDVNFGKVGTLFDEQRQFARSKLCPTGGQISKRVDMDGACPSPRSRTNFGRPRWSSGVME